MQTNPCNGKSPPLNFHIHPLLETGRNMLYIIMNYDDPKQFGNRSKRKTKFFFTSNNFQLQQRPKNRDCILMKGQVTQLKDIAGKCEHLERFLILFSSCETVSLIGVSNPIYSK